MNKRSLFQNNPKLVGFSLSDSISSFSIFREFISALEDNGINLTDTNFTEFDLLCDEFDFTELAGKLSEFRSLMGFKGGEATAEAESENADARGCTRTNCSA
jgi:hypothetical protein